MSTITKQIETATELITPEIAKKYLERNRCNRNLSYNHRDKLARAMSDGEFHHTHQGIAFDVDGDLIDGQHRLSAIIESDTIQAMQVTRNVSVKSRTMVDNQGRPRSARDALAMEGHGLATKSAVAICRMWMHLLGERTPAVHEIRSFLNAHSPSIEFACEVAAGNPILKHACVATMVAVAHEAGHGDEVERWADVIRTGMASQQWQSSATKFRDWWMTTRHNGGSSVRIECCQRVYASMSAWTERRGLAKLYAKQSIEWLDVQ